MRHLAVFDQKEIIEKILRGEKTMEVRFSRIKTAPYGIIQRSDQIFLKEAGGLILGQVEVDNVLFYDNLSPEIIGKLKREYNQELIMGDDFWQKYGKSKYASLIFLKNPQRFISPLRFRKKDRRAWLVLKNWDKESWARRKK